MTDPVREALTELVAKLDKIAVASVGTFQVAEIHGCAYNGPTWEKEIEAARAALSAPTGESVHPAGAQPTTLGGLSIDDISAPPWLEPVVVAAWNHHLPDLKKAIGASLELHAAEAGSSSAWLIEHSGALPGLASGQVSWMCVELKFEGFGARELGYTHDASEALRFARKEDAEAVLAMHLGASPPDWYSKPFSVTEHQWIAGEGA